MNLGIPTPSRYASELYAASLIRGPGFSHTLGQYESQWAAIESIAAKIGCTSETLRRWVRQAERDEGLRPGPTTAEQQRIKELEREVRELRQTNEILKLASAFFAKAELDRHHKK